MKKTLIYGMLMVAILFTSIAVSPVSHAAPVTLPQLEEILASLLEKVAALKKEIASQKTESDAPQGGARTERPDTNNSERPRPLACSLIQRNLSEGISGEDVKSLQDFLRSEGHFSAESTGYFGKVTAQAVLDWQKKENIDPVGIVGQHSRDRIRERCTLPREKAVPDVLEDPDEQPGRACTMEYAPVCGETRVACNSRKCEHERETYSNMCHLENAGARFVHKGECEVDADNEAPTIISVTKQPPLHAGNEGMWRIVASDPEGEPLAFTISWGDKTPDEKKKGAKSLKQKYETSFTHTYSEAGTYRIEVTAQDTDGNQSQKDVTVEILAADESCNETWDPVCGLPNEACDNECDGLDCPMTAMMCRLPEPQTYGNHCKLKVAHATLLHEGECTPSSAGGL